METPAPALFRIRAAEPHDVPALMRLKGLLAESEGGTHILRASEADWLRDGFGDHPGFSAFVAEVSGDMAAGAIVAMATCSKRVITGWNGPVVFLQDLFVEAGFRELGIARALVARIAAFAREIGSPIVELNVRADNPAQIFYERNGFAPLPQCRTYVLAGPALEALAAPEQSAPAPQAALSFEPIAFNQKTPAAAAKSSAHRPRSFQQEAARQTGSSGETDRDSWREAAPR